MIPPAANFATPHTLPNTANGDDSINVRKKTEHLNEDPNNDIGGGFLGFLRHQFPEWTLGMPGVGESSDGTFANPPLADAEITSVNSLTEERLQNPGELPDGVMSDSDATEDSLSAGTPVEASDNLTMVMDATLFGEGIDQELVDSVYRGTDDHATDEPTSSFTESRADREETLEVESLAEGDIVERESIQKSEVARQPMLLATGSSSGTMDNQNVDSGTEQVSVPRMIHPVVQEALLRGTQVQRSGSEEFLVRLDPPELGEVVVQMTRKDKGFRLKVRAVDPQTHLLFEQHAGELQEALLESGGEFEVATDDNLGERFSQGSRFPGSMIGSPPIGFSGVHQGNTHGRETHVMALNFHA
ncbi:MAG: flagellar hook-length control protein FliK [Planctomycetaceae bacterium]|nr:flagellar hook-length control protein FliK [Planctomycetaceae bacterium]